MVKISLEQKLTILRDVSAQAQKIMVENTEQQEQIFAEATLQEALEQS